MLRTAARRSRHHASRIYRTFSTLPDSAEATESKYVVPTYSKQGVRSKPGLVFSHGQGNYLYDTDDNKYLDMSAGIAVSCLGHGNPEWTQAVSGQLDKLVHVSNLYHSEPYLTLSKKLIDMSDGFSKVFFCNSGTEANEGALKFARVIANATRDPSLPLQPDRSRFISFQNSFHGRSLGALSMTWKPAIREPFTPLLNNNVTFCPFNDLEAVKRAMDVDVCGVIVEPVQGEGGVTPASIEFLQGLRQLCDQYGASLICDEIQIGLGRTGAGYMYGHQPYGIVPDIMTLAKPLAGGLPIGAVLLSDTAVAKVPSEAWLGTHGTTFGANPVVCEAANVVLDNIAKPEFLESVKEAGAVLVEGLDAIAREFPERVKEVRYPVCGEALYGAVQFHEAGQAGPVITRALDEGVLVIGAGDHGDCLRICPPLSLTPANITDALQVIREAILATVPAKQVGDEETMDAASGSVYVNVADWPTAFDGKEAYYNHLESIGQLPEGFKVGTSSFTFKPKELGASATEMPMNLTVISMDQPTDQYAALFTQNAFPGAPVVVGKDMVNQGKKLGGIVINNKISNVHPRGGGVQDAMDVANAVKAELFPDEQDAAILPSSTGVIGWSLPRDELIGSVPSTISDLSAGSAVKAAAGIMTTDTYPKLRSATIKLSDGTLGRVVGIAKGAGMIEPNMATMLVYVMTDVALGSKQALHSSLKEACNAPKSFNRISVDSDQSTSDTIVLLSSGTRQVATKADADAFQEALDEVCASLAQDVVRNGEGTQHVIKVQVNGSPSKAIAHGVGKAVVNSPLVKTAIAGNDPNVGRLICAIGNYLGKADSSLAARAKRSCTITMGGIEVFRNGEFVLDESSETRLIKYLKSTELLNTEELGYPRHFESVEIVVDLNAGEESTSVIGSDLTHEYISVNADYRS